MNNATFPGLLKKLNQLEYDYDDGEGIDFEPFEEFTSLEDTNDWLHSWTGNPNADGSIFLIFGQDGSGGYAAFWLVNVDNPLDEQPIVFLGSEGERGVVASNLDDYLWVLASGHGPYEAIAYLDEEKEPSEPFLEFANQHSQKSNGNGVELCKDANKKYLGFSDFIDSICD